MYLQNDVKVLAQSVVPIDIHVSIIHIPQKKAIGLGKFFEKYSTALPIALAFMGKLR